MLGVGLETLADLGWSRDSLKFSLHNSVLVARVFHSPEHWAVFLLLTCVFNAQLFSFDSVFNSS